MKRFRLPWLLGLSMIPGPLLFACHPPDEQPCATVPRDDPDGDGLLSHVECLLGTDPNKSDSDGDGLRDHAEYSYPQICVADDRATQRRPAARCESNADCSTGERCTGLNPTNPDSDGDGVKDGDEDVNGRGVIDLSSGVTDPRLWDSDGDGTSDGESGVRICLENVWLEADRVAVGGFLIVLDPAFDPISPVPATTMARAALVFDDKGAGVAGLAARQMTTRPTVNDDRLEIEQAIRSALTGAGAVVTDVAVGRARGAETISSTFRVTQSGTTASALRNAVVGALCGGSSPSAASVGGGDTFYLDVSTIRMGGGTITILLGFSELVSHDDPTRDTAIRVSDLVNGSALGLVGESPLPQCRGQVSAGGFGAIPLSGDGISSSLRVAVRNLVVPRSRLDGFDYAQDTNAVVFFGNTYRPQPGDTVFTFRRWWGVFD